jgi:hypothetical protein
MLYLYVKALDPDYPIEYVMHTNPKMHGLNNEEYLKIPKDTKLFIMADGGTNDAFEFNELIKNGIDCCILDHHDSNYQDESQEENTSSLLDTDKIIKNANKAVSNALSGYNKKNNITNNYSEPSENITYKETKYKTGDSPYASYFGYGGKKGQFDKNSLSKLTIINHSSKEAVVLLEKTNGFVVRNVYISNNSQFTLTNIPEGYYRIKVMYGNSWNSEKNNGSNFPKGGFMKNVSFSKSIV